MPHNLDTPTLTPQELVFLEHFAFTGNKRQAFVAAGYGKHLSKDQVYHKARTILVKAQHSQGWQDALARHELTHDELAKRLKELVYSSDSRTAVQALKLALQTTGLLREQPQVMHATQIVIHTAAEHPATTPQERGKPLDIQL